jgi:hypothetical protein
MNPYDRTAEEMKRQSEGPKRFAQQAGRTAIEAGLTYGAASFAPVLARAAPFLSEYIPEHLAIKGLSKIHPKLGAFVKKAMDSGYDWNEAKNFLGDQIKASQEQESPENAENPHKTGKNAKESRNIIEKYSPELHQFIDQEIKKGRPVIQAGALAQNDKRFTDIIKKLSKDHKTDWSSILEAVYGGAQSPNASQQQQSPQQGQQMQPAQAQGGQVYYDYDRGSQQQKGQPGKGEQSLMSILNELNQKRRQ